ncbi:hypothetical protein [Flagellimonas lutaonensis]|uniref:Uncharacterized protein n=1 Tax=Flagellimonas lutaonensis TaxID=516051 RepID=A0A0D5YWV3_9FLAO|nr:hypothetical protein [Allomuricauda lutaonensis]AKA36369.1 hypothetical protein VC82_2823 [Allomuricauda lutaonensis]
MKLKRPKLNSDFWSSDKLFGLTAMLISLVTLIIFVKQTNIMDKQTRLSVLPYLMIEQSTNSEAHTIQLSLANHGVGPAIIESRKIVYENKEYDQDFYTFMTESLPELDSIEPFNWSNVYRGMAIPSNGRVTMIAIGSNVEEFERFGMIMGKLQRDKSFYYEIIYSSIYGDKWKLSSDSEVPEKLD